MPDADADADSPSASKLVVPLMVIPFFNEYTN